MTLYNVAIDKRDNACACVVSRSSSNTPGTQQGDSFVCSNRFIQISIVVLVLVMAFW